MAHDERGTERADLSAAHGDDEGPRRALGYVEPRLAANQPHPTHLSIVIYLDARVGVQHDSCAIPQQPDLLLPYPGHDIVAVPVIHHDSREGHAGGQAGCGDPP